MKIKNKERISVMLSPSLIEFMKNYSKFNNKTQSDTIAESLKVFRKLIENEELKNAYLNEVKISDNFENLAVDSFYNDFVK